MILPVCATCDSCHFFRRFAFDSGMNSGEFAPVLVDDLEATLSEPTLTTEPDTDLVDYGKCIRNPPQFLASTLNGEWPVIHKSRVCGEYQPNGCQN